MSNRGQTGPVTLASGQWATGTAEPILMKMPERPTPAWEYSSEARTEPGAGLRGWSTQLCIHLVREPFRVRLDHRSA